MIKSKLALMLGSDERDATVDEVVKKMSEFVSSLKRGDPDKSF